MQDVPRDSGSPGEHGAATVGGARTYASSTILQRSDPLSTPLLWGQAFPVAAWRKVLGDRSVTVSLDGGHASLLGARNGHVRRHGPLVDGRREICLGELDDDWLWADGDAGPVTWTLPEHVELPPLTVVIPTYRREEDVLAQARRFLQMGIVASVVVVDQGGTLADHREFARLLSAYENLQLVTQPNLGGSGGYARGMLEASRDPAASVLFSDDDAVLSEESLRR
ncbi:MAG: glycosyltransferase, partial [Brachybacterium sp.]|nr:glycosyltransferase [Brachybacterium sp.]